MCCFHANASRNHKPNLPFNLNQPIKMLGLQFGVIVVCIAAISTNNDHSEKPSSSNCTTHMTQCSKNYYSQAMSSSITCGSIETVVGCIFHSGCNVTASHREVWASLLQRAMDYYGSSCPFTLARLINPDSNSADVTRATSTVVVVASTLAFLLGAFVHLR
ncbi:unnamed protein product [Lymnaea stagnalis]|uniref:Uncharacterized protein n=1 Tax=Lymnaea stagnalis TaxID=6523 RepID=A0AAV2HGC2_LYMST